MGIFFETPCRFDQYYLCNIFVQTCEIKPLVFFAHLEPLVNFVHTLLKHYSGYFCRLTVNSQPDGAAEKLFSLNVAILRYSVGLF